MVLQLISTTLQLRQAINGASAGRNIGLSLGVFVYAILIMGRKCREMSGWDSFMNSGLNCESTILTNKMAGISFSLYRMSLEFLYYQLSICFCSKNCVIKFYFILFLDLLIY
jgi:hypothetical protein